MSVIYDNSFIEEDFINENESLFFPTSYESNHSFSKIFYTIKTYDIYDQLIKKYYELVLSESTLR